MNSPGLIRDLADNEVFVFGSNMSGRHGRGAAKTAMKWGAKYGQASGPQGRTYGIPTKDKEVRNTLPLSNIRSFVDEFTDYAKNNPQKVFLVTEIGCGLAGLDPKEVGPLFSECVNMKNVLLPKRFTESIQAK